MRAFGADGCVRLKAHLHIDQTSAIHSMPNYAKDLNNDLGQNPTKSSNMPANKYRQRRAMRLPTADFRHQKA